MGVDADQEMVNLAQIGAVDEQHAILALPSLPLGGACSVSFLEPSSFSFRSLWLLGGLPFATN